MNPPPQILPQGEELEEADASGAAPPAQGATDPPPPHAHSLSESMHGRGADFESTMDEPSSSLAVTGIDLEVPFKLQPADGAARHCLLPAAA
jgi:hypothetical protein